MAKVLSGTDKLLDYMESRETEKEFKPDQARACDSSEDDRNSISGLFLLTWRKKDIEKH